jgi:hypothetical protein
MRGCTKKYSNNHEQPAGSYVILYLNPADISCMNFW